MNVIALAPVVLAGSSVAHASETFDGQTFFFGDLHSHTGVSPDGYASDGGQDEPGVQRHWESVTSACLGTSPDCGAMDSVFDTAIENGLDFMALTDHDDSNAKDFNYLLKLSLERTDIVVIPSVELKYSTPSVAKYGHKNMYVFQDDVAALEGLDLATLAANQTVRDGQCNVDIWTNVAAVNAVYGPSLLWAHHPSANAVQTTDWDCHDETWEPVVEIYSHWGNALTYDALYDPTDKGIDKSVDDADAADATVHAALERGYKLGFVGGTDEHVTRPGGVCQVSGDPAESGHDYGGGLTMVALDEGVALTRAAIYEELTAGRTLVTSGPRIPFQVEWTLARGGGTAGIGEEIDVPTRGATTVTVHVPSGYEAMVTSVRAVGNTTSYTLRKRATEAGSWSRAIANDTIPSWLYVEIEIDGTLYYPDVCEDGGTGASLNDEYLWSSPTWFARGS
jgi:predicted metal-dependent phosphoesterase TrpH